jgi:hypothetical protein
LCKHDHTSQFSLSQEGSAASKKQCVLDHCKKKHPVQTETRNLAAMFVDGMRNENDKWWDGTLLARLPKAHAKYPLYYSVRNTDGEVAYTPLVHEDYGVDREWVIYGNVEGKLGPLPGKGPSRDLTLVGQARPGAKGGGVDEGKEGGKGAQAQAPFWARSWGYSAFQYILLGRTPKTNRCASRFADRLG